MKSVTLALLLSLLVSGVWGCAGGETDPGPTRDNCRLRDCGAAVGGQDLGYEEEDDGVYPEDTRPYVDSAAPDARPDAPCTTPSGAACALFPQCGCAAGMSCDVPPASYADGRAACVTAGSRGRHQRCTTVGECAAGLTCYYDVCMPLCAANSDCAGAGTPLCSDRQYESGGVAKPVPGLRVCTAQCDPLNPAKVCGASTTCLFHSKSVTTCAAAGLSTTATSCASNRFACAPGYVCVSGGDCKRWCRIGLAGDCPGGKACTKLPVPAGSEPTIGTIEYGVCAY